MRWCVRGKIRGVLVGIAFFTILMILIVFVLIHQWSYRDVTVTKAVSHFSRSSADDSVAAVTEMWEGQDEQTTHITYIKLEGVDSSEHDMFVVYGATIEQLKAVCSGLSDCEGFNSEGWVKSRADSKKRSPSINLYVKQSVSRLPVTITDEDAGVYNTYITDYDNMEQNLKIYIYDTVIGQDMPSYKDYKYGVEYLFISLLAKSKFRTKNPQEANFYFIPARCSAYRKSVSSLTDGINRAAETMSHMIEEIKHKYPYWNESLGMDHFYICAHDMGTDLVKTSDPNLWKNSIGLVNTADSSEPMFVPHKDISLPPHPGRGSIDWAVIGEGGATFDPKLRTKLVFMAGHPGRGPVRPNIYQFYDQDTDFHLVKGYISDDDYMYALKTTKFCLCPHGNKAWSPRLMDALWFGCIPVIIADHYILPLTQVINWDSISVTIMENQVTELKEILQSIPSECIAQMQLRIQSVYKHLTWNNPPQPYDAFHSTLFQLWLKRNVRRKQNPQS